MFVLSQWSLHTGQSVAAVCFVWVSELLPEASDIRLSLLLRGNELDDGPAARCWNPIEMTGLDAAEGIDRHTHWKQTHSARRAAIKSFYIIPAKSYVMLVVIRTWSWSSELSRGFCLWGSLRLRGCSGYSGIWGEACPALLFLGLSFCLWAHEVNSWLVLPTEPGRMSRNIIYQKKRGLKRVSAGKTKDIFK